MSELELIQHCLEEHKAEGIVTIDVSGVSPFASYYVIATAQNPRALGAIKEHVEEALEKAGYEITLSEGENDSGWVISQAEDVIVHLFLEANRRMINLEELLERIKGKSAKA